MPADLVAILDTLRLHLLALSVDTPYYHSRLVRVTQQLDYVARACPPQDWPVKRPLDSPAPVRQVQRIMPTQQQFLWQVAELQVILQAGAPTRPGYAWHQHLLDLILCLL